MKQKEEIKCSNAQTIKQRLCVHVDHNRKYLGQYECDDKVTTADMSSSCTSSETQAAAGNSSQAFTVGIAAGNLDKVAVLSGVGVLTFPYQLV